MSGDHRAPLATNGLEVASIDLMGVIVDHRNQMRDNGWTARGFVRLIVGLVCC